MTENERINIFRNGDRAKHLLGSVYDKAILGAFLH